MGEPDVSKPGKIYRPRKDKPKLAIVLEAGDSDVLVLCSRVVNFSYSIYINEMMSPHCYVCYCNIHVNLCACLHLILRSIEIQV